MLLVRRGGVEVKKARHFAQVKAAFPRSVPRLKRINSDVMSSGRISISLILR
jgi:hypothetical protein